MQAGPFDMLICVGEFFGQDDAENEAFLKSADTTVNVPTYILGKIDFKLYSLKLGGKVEGAKFVLGGGEVFYSEHRL